MEEIFTLKENSDFIALNQLLKAVGCVENGAMANQVIMSGKVIVNGEVEFRKRAKIRKCDEVIFFGEEELSSLKIKIS